MRIVPRALFVLLLVGLAVGGLGGPSSAAGETAARLHHVVIEDFAFHPQRLEVRPGDRVEWTNLDIAPHSASAGHGAWDSGGLAKRESHRVTFEAPGRFAYFCAFHPMMRGEIVVAPP